jgi:hypothetical protein
MQKTIFLLLVLIALFYINATKNQGKSIITDNSKNLAQMVTNEDFQSFWIDFRGAIISLDYIKLIEMTNFPLKSHGKMDGDPQFLIYKDRFYYFLKVCLNEDTGRTMDGETNLDFIKKTSKLEEGVYFTKSENWCRVAAMEFQKINNSWKLTRIYFDTTHYKDK